MRWGWGEGQHGLARVLLGHLDTEGMNSELGGFDLTQCRAPCVGHGWESAAPWAWQPWEMLHFCRVGGGWGRSSHVLGGILPEDQLSPG